MRRFALLVGIAAAAWLALPRPPLKEGLPLSQAVFDRRGNLLRLTASEDGKFRLWLPLAEIAPSMTEAVLLQEDRCFWRHPGVNPWSLARGAWSSYVLRSRRVGGSTITMQVARLRYGLRTTTPLGKLHQILKALQLELKRGKRDILEAYLNLMPLGGNIEGVGGASLLYFGKEARRLSVAEAISLAVIPKHPARRGPAYKESDTIQERRGLAARWRQRHPGDPAAQAEAALPLARTPPFLAPHFAEAAMRDASERTVLKTTLDPSLQALLERQVNGYIEQRRANGIRNAAALLLDYRAMEVRAAVGSAGYFDASIQGQVNGFRAKRSPGSALKPFVYALGFDQGVLHPATVLKDAPASFGGYNPENFDKDFMGPMSARDALIRSRNIPAVWVASRLAEPRLHQFLTSAGVAGLKDEKFYGLSLALGGAEVTMEELVRLYAMLANGGELKPLRRLSSDAPAEEGVRLLSEDASFMALDILKDNPRPGQAWSRDWTADPLPVYWKTGTSFGYRDAWSAGIFGPYVLAVWAGNFDNTGDPALIGLEAAAPLFFRVVDAVRAQQRSMPGVVWAPKNVTAVNVCPVSGQLPGPNCRRQAKTWYLPGRSPIGICEVHRAIPIDERTGLRACGERPGTRTEIFEFWPSDLLKLFRMAGVPRRVPPDTEPGCALEERATRGGPPMITSPASGVEVILRAAQVGRETVPLTAVADADVRELHWFADERYLGRSAPAQSLLWTPQPGRVTLRAVDDHGRAGALNLRISVVP